MTMIDEKIERVVKLKVIQPGQSPWSSPVVLLSKSNSSTRLCINYRRLNTLSVRDSFPLPFMDDAFVSLGDATLFVSIDARQSFCQILVANDDVPKTAIPPTKDCMSYSDCLFRKPRN